MTDLAPVNAFSCDHEDERVLKLHFNRKVTDEDRKWLLDAINAWWPARESPLSPPLHHAQTVLAPDHVAVPKAALDWLFGQGPDDKGWLFGECSEAQKAMNTKNPRRYWWRAKFRTMLSAVPSTNCGGDK